MSKKAPKQRVTIMLDPEKLAWLKEQVELEVFGSISHGINRCIQIATESGKFD